MHIERQLLSCTAGKECAVCRAKCKTKRLDESDCSRLRRNTWLRVSSVPLSLPVWKGNRKGGEYTV